MSAILETTVERWTKVREENEKDKIFIDPQSMRQWERFDEETSGRLRKIIEGYNGNLSDADRDWIRELNQSIDKAKRVTRTQLEQEKKAREEAEAKRAHEQELKDKAAAAKLTEIESTKHSLLRKLGF